MNTKADILQTLVPSFFRAGMKIKSRKGRNVGWTLGTLGKARTVVIFLQQYK